MQHYIALLHFSHKQPHTYTTHEMGRKTVSNYQFEHTKENKNVEIY